MAEDSYLPPCLRSPFASPSSSPLRPALESPSAVSKFFSSSPPPLGQCAGFIPSLDSGVISLLKTQSFPLRIPASIFPEIAVFLLTLGLMITAVLFIYEVSMTKFERSFVKEVFLATAASAFLGIGTAFLLLWTGVYF